MQSTHALEADLLDPDTFADGVPHDLLERIRRPGIVRIWSPSAQISFWMTARHKDVAEISRDVSGFSSQLNGTILRGARPISTVAESPDQPDERGPALTIIDPPRHTFLRKLVHRWFTPRAMAHLEQQVRAVVTAILDRVEPQGGCDFVQDIAAPLPAEMSGMLLGIPPADRSWVASTGDLVNGAEDPDYLATAHATPPWAPLIGYAHQLVAESEPGSDNLLSSLLHTEIDGQRITRLEFEWMFFLLVVASNGTTRDALSSGAYALATHPDQRRRLLDDKDLLPSAVEEILRWSTPVLYFSRTATRDVELHGQTIQRGDQIALSFAGANFDPRVFDRPREFNVARRPNPHVTFGGGGPHICLGAHLARLEVRIMLEELLRRIPNLEPTSTPERLRSHINNGYKRMPVTWSKPHRRIA